MLEQRNRSRPRASEHPFPLRLGSSLSRPGQTTSCRIASEKIPAATSPWGLLCHNVLIFRIYPPPPVRMPRPVIAPAVFRQNTGFTGHSGDWARTGSSSAVFRLHLISISLSRAKWLPLLTQTPLYRLLGQTLQSRASRTCSGSEQALQLGFMVHGCPGPRNATAQDYACGNLLSP